tara:strand:- start:586 stop:840 length:255 start_codon:yes stop_codon:yes gene_type:complete
MKVINYEVHKIICGTTNPVRYVTVEYKDEHGRERAPLENVKVGANDSDEDILRQCEEAIAPPVDNRTLVRKAKDAVDAFFDVCK